MFVKQQRISNWKDGGYRRMKNKIFLISSVIIFLAAGLLMSFTTWAFFICRGVITQAKAAGQLTASGNEYDIVSFYMSNCGQYFIYTLLLAAVGLLLFKWQPQEARVPVSNAKNNANDEELDEWFDGMDKKGN